MEMQDEAVTTSIWTRPPMLYLGGLILGIVLKQLIPVDVGLADYGNILWATGGSIAIAGLTIALSGILNFTRASTPVQSVKPVQELVTTGIHGWSRNPIYVGLILLYIGIGLIMANIWVLMLICPVTLVVRYVVIAREEAYLERRFGDAFREYRSRVRRWL